MKRVLYSILTMNITVDNFPDGESFHVCNLCESIGPNEYEY
jgi:hypothetical protein